MFTFNLQMFNLVLILCNECTIANGFKINNRLGITFKW